MNKDIIKQSIICCWQSLFLRRTATRYADTWVFQFHSSLIYFLMEHFGKTRGRTLRGIWSTICPSHPDRANRCCRVAKASAAYREKPSLAAAATNRSSLCPLVFLGTDSPSHQEAVQSDDAFSEWLNVNCKCRPQLRVEWRKPTQKIALF